MKTAETWESEQECTLDKAEHIIAFVRAVQLDAIKYGMTLAAIEAEEYPHTRAARIRAFRDNFQLP